MLDLAALVKQVTGLAGSQADFLARAAASCETALETLAGPAADWERVGERVRDAATSWLLAEPLGPLSLPVSAPASSMYESHAVIAVDGSQIAPDRHESALCCLINVGRVRLAYGDAAAAALTSVPSLHYGEADTASALAGDRGTLGVRSVAQLRSAAEWGALADMAALEGGDIPAVALLDGSLILWSLQSEPEGVRRAALRPYLEMLHACRDARVPVAGYISRPGSRDVVNSLRVCRCPHDRADCDRHCAASSDAQRRGAPCAGVQDLTDAGLYGALLGAGERSALFASRSGVLADYPDEHRTTWFYLNAGPEVARVEVPRWVADDAAALELVHAVVWQQACRGGGYPPALAEAHEQAVVRSADRLAFMQLVDNELVRAGVPLNCTRKALAKRRRAV